MQRQETELSHSLLVDALGRDLLVDNRSAQNLCSLLTRLFGNLLQLLHEQASELGLGRLDEGRELLRLHVGWEGGGERQLRALL